MHCKSNVDVDRRTDRRTDTRSHGAFLRRLVNSTYPCARRRRAPSIWKRGQALRRETWQRQGGKAFSNGKTIPTTRNFEPPIPSTKQSFSVNLFLRALLRWKKCTLSRGGEQRAMEASWTMVMVIGKGNWERIVLPSTPLLEDTTYQQTQTKTILKPSFISFLVMKLILRNSKLWWLKTLESV